MPSRSSRVATAAVAATTMLAARGPEEREGLASAIDAIVLSQMEDGPTRGSRWRSRLPHPGWLAEEVTEGIIRHGVRATMTEGRRLSATLYRRGSPSSAAVGRP